MRTLNIAEMEQVSGGDWSFGFDLKVVYGEVSGNETIQDIVGGAADGISDAYWTARDATADLYGWMFGYDSMCNGGGGR